MNTKVYILVVFFSLAIHFSFGQAFITTWIPTNSGTLYIPTHEPSGPYNYDIVWENLNNTGVGNGSFSGATGSFTINGLVPNDTYRVSITGVFPHFYMNNNYTYKNTIQSIEQFGNIQWISFQNAFAGCNFLKLKAIDSPDLSAVTNMSRMFVNCYSLTSFPFLTTPGIVFFTGWDTSNVTNMSSMFEDAYFDQPLGNWNVSNVTDMNGMFKNAKNFNQELNNWNVSNVTNMSNMFSGAENFNQPISNWNVSNVTDMYGMFGNTFNFNQPIGNWNVSNVTNMAGMFFSSRFNGDLNSWDVSNVTNMRRMFGALYYNIFPVYFGGSLNNWDVSNVIDMTEMFLFNQSFNHSLGNWTFNTNVNISSLFANSAISCENYSYSLIGWANNPLTPNNLSLNINGRSYSSGAIPARNFLINNKGWIINFDVLGSCLLSNNEFEQTTLQVYPNPADEVVYVNYAFPIKTIKIFNLLGQEVFDFTPNSLDIELPISHLKTGTYLLKISTVDQEEKLVKLIKK